MSQRKRRLHSTCTDQAEANRKSPKTSCPDPFDAWDKNAAEYHAQTAGSGTLSSSPYAYGLNDMGYYGSFMDAGGCGSMWRPYFASAAWDPYSNGVWAWYQGAGYSWVSPYPWGWTPYHYGSWSYCPGAGWGWRPGGSWNGLNNSTAFGPGGGPGTCSSPTGQAAHRGRTHADGGEPEASGPFGRTSETLLSCAGIQQVWAFREKAWANWISFRNAPWTGVRRPRSITRAVRLPNTPIGAQGK